jgi:hypothetical protein
MARVRVALGIALTLVATPLIAQNAPPPVRVRGVVERLDGDQLTVRSREGPRVRIALAASYAVVAVTKAELAEVKAGTFVGTAARPQADGTLRAQEVLIFPESARGTGEGHYPWDLTPDSTMTNATVADVVQGVDGSLLRLMPKGREVRVLVPPDAPIVTLGPGDPSLLVPGAAVFLSASPQGDGSLSAARILVGKDGVIPPM